MILKWPPCITPSRNCKHAKMRRTMTVSNIASRLDATTASPLLNLLTVLDIQRELASLRSKIQEDMRKELRVFFADGISTSRGAATDVCSPDMHASAAGFNALESLSNGVSCLEQAEAVSHPFHVPKPCDDAPNIGHVPKPRGDAPSVSMSPLSEGVLRNTFLPLPGTTEDIVHTLVHATETDSDSETKNCSRINRWKVLCSGLLQGRSILHESWRHTSSDGLERSISHMRPSGFQVMSVAIPKRWTPINDSEEAVTWWVIDPFSTRRVTWDFIGILLCMYDLIMVPVLTAFTMPPSYGSFRTVREICGACFWTLDMLVSFATGTLDKDGLVELRPRKIARKYATTWLVFDLIIVTTDWVVIFLNALGTSGSMRISKAFTRILRASRLFRILKFSEKAQEVLGTVESESLFTIGKVLKHIAVVFVICHYFACAWYIIGTMQDDSRSWVRKFLSDNDSNVYSYAVSLHFSLTQFTLGHAEITPQTASEAFFVSIVLVSALLVFSFFTSNMSRVVAHLEEVNASELAQDVLIRRFGSENDVPRRLMARVRNFKRQRSRTLTRRKVSESDVEIFQALPVGVIQQLREHRFMPHLLAHPVFKQCLVLNAKTLLELSWSGIEDAFLWPDQEFFPNGVNVNRMIFLKTGRLRYRFREDSSVEEDAIVLPGQWVCEETLWSQTSCLFGPFVACDASELMLVIPAKLREIMCRDLICAHFLGHYATLFVNRFNQASCDESDDCVLFNNPDTLEGMVKAAWEEHINQTQPTVLKEPD